MQRPIAVFLAFAVQAGACAAETWQVLKPDGLGFSVELPATPNSEEQDVDIGNGQSAKMRTFQVLSDNVIYDVTLADYPNGVVQSIGQDQVLDNARNGMLSSSPSPLRSETKFEFAGRPARELLVDMPMGMSLRCRIFFVGDRLFNVGAIMPKGNEQSAPVEKYLASFKLSDAPKP